MESDLTERRVMHAVGLIDQNGDGVLERSDFATWVGRLAAIRGWEPGSEGYVALEGLFLETLTRLQAAYGGEDGRVEVDLLGRTMVAVAAAGGADLTSWADGFFALMDADGDGVIGPDEYRDLLGSLRVGGSVVDDAFAKLDLNGDGHLSKDEFRQLHQEFWTTDDPSAAANWLWGPFA